jgi:hypothetical protein
MSDVQPIDQQSEICQVLTCLPEKFVVDFANGIDVARERQRYMDGRSSFFARMYDGFTGQGARHQNAINASLTDGVEGALNWLTDLSESLARSNLAIARVNDRVNALKADVTTIASFSLETRNRLNILSQRLDERCDVLEREVARIDFVQRAQLSVDEVFNKWGAGRYRSLSLSGRGYAALEELRWSDFGDYCRQASGSDRQKVLESLANRTITQMNRDAGLERRERIAMRERWMAHPAGRDVLSDARDALAYMGDGFAAEKAPFVFAISQSAQELPIHVPLLSSAERLTESMISELFLEAEHV